jgi:hypothetical protein
LFLAGLTCPSPEPFPPPSLSAPVFLKMEVAAFKFDTYRPAIHLQWRAPSHDSLGIKEFVILKKTQSDSGFSVLVRSIPDSISNFYEAADNVGFPSSDYKAVTYRIFAIDTIGRAGDTSAADSVVLVWPPQPVQPKDFDTLAGEDSLVWSVSNVQAGFFTYLFIYNDSLGLVWKSPKPLTPSFLTDGQTGIFGVVLPQVLLPLTSGVYSWAVKIEAPAKNAESMAMRRFYAR